MRKTKIAKPLIYSIASIAAPIIAICVFVLYKAAIHSNQGNHPTHQDSGPEALFAFVEVIQLLFTSILGFTIGLTVSIFHIRQQGRFYIPGLAALLFNGIPLLLLLSIYLKGVIFGL